MKKVFLSLAVVCALGMVACSSSDKATEDTAAVAAEATEQCDDTATCDSTKAECDSPKAEAPAEEASAEATPAEAPTTEQPA